VMKWNYRHIYLMKSSTKNSECQNLLSTNSLDGNRISWRCHWIYFKGWTTTNACVLWHYIATLYIAWYNFLPCECIMHEWISLLHIYSFILFHNILLCLCFWRIHVKLVMFFPLKKINVKYP
jgi:hypothetical protein